MNLLQHVRILSGKKCDCQKKTDRLSTGVSVLLAHFVQKPVRSLVTGSWTDNDTGDTG